MSNDNDLYGSDDYADDYGDSYGDAFGNPYDDGVDLRPCPHCGEDIYEESVACPECGELIDWRRSRSSLEGRPMWWVVLGVIGIIATCVALIGH